ncbi:MAG: prepilin-type N-terminal cleavage/methylation domain-containing protein [Ruminococcaceae bacterium]|nr:prepilin-type N-terminal cleavage/methylation domain-containing protein [Oscillospiraceae bacterium]
MKKMNNKGFTLMEMLIVVAIIAVLVAIAIPVMTTQLENAREATDAANIRSAYAEVSVALLTGDSSNLSKTVTLKQKVDGWGNSEITLPVVASGNPEAGGTCDIVGNPDTGVVSITFVAAP